MNSQQHSSSPSSSPSPFSPEGIFKRTPNETAQAILWWGEAVVNQTTLFHPYWTTFEPQPADVYWALGVLVAVVAVLSVLGNGAVVYAFGSSRSLHKVKVFTINLSLSDFLSCLLTYWMFVYNSWFGRWSFSKTACTAYAATQGIFGFISIGSLAAIALERYAAISRSSSRWRRLSLAAKVCVCAAIWAYCAVVVSGPLWGMGSYVAAGFLQTCCFDYIDRSWDTRAFIGFLVVFGFAIPTTVIIYCYYYIYRSAMEAGRMLKARMAAKSGQTLQLGRARPDGAGGGAGTADAQGFLRPDDPSGRDSRFSISSSVSMGSDISNMSNMDEVTRIKGKDVRAAKLCIVVVGIFVVSWTPYACVALLGQFGPARFVTPWMAMVPSVIAKSSTLYNPFLYLYKDSRFQRAFKKYVLRRDLGRSIKTDSLTTNYIPPLLPASASQQPLREE